MMKRLIALVAVLMIAAGAIAEEELCEMELVDDAAVAICEDTVMEREPDEEAITPDAEALMPAEEAVAPMATAEPRPQLRAAATPAPCVKKLPSGKYTATLGDTVTVPLEGFCTDFEISSTKYCTVAKGKKALTIVCERAGTAKVTLVSQHNPKVKTTITVKVTKVSKSLGTRTYTLKYGEEVHVRYKDLGFSDRFPYYTYECSNRFLTFFSPRKGFIDLKLSTPKKCTIKIKLYRYDDWGNCEYCTIKLKCSY